MDSVWIGLIGAVIGGLLSLVGALAIEVFRERRRARNLRSAFTGELRAILAAVDTNQFIHVLDNLIREIQASQQARFLTIRVGGDMHNAVFRANADQLGLLAAPLPERLAFAHYEINGVALDLKSLADMAEGGGGEEGTAIRSDWRQCLQRHDSVLRRCRRTREIVADVINELEGAR